MNLLERLGERIAKKQLKNPIIFIILLILILLLISPGIFLLLNHVEPSLEKVLPQKVNELKTMNLMRGEFGADMIYLLIKAEGPVYDVRDKSVINYMDLLESKLRTNNYILEVNGLPELINQVNNNVLPDSTEKIKELLLLNPNTPIFLNQDYSIAVIQIKSDTGSTSAVINEVIQEIMITKESLEENNPGVSVTITGFNAIDRATFKVMMKDFSFITIFSFIFMLIFLLFYFNGSIKKIISSLSVIIFSLIITLGITGYLNITITVVTMVSAAMIMALGISYGINITYEYYLLRKKYDLNKSIIALDKGLIRALTGSSFTTSAGFLALLFGVIPAMKNLGIVLAIGILITLLISIFFSPVIIILLNDDSKIKNNKVGFFKNKLIK